MYGRFVTFRNVVLPRLAAGADGVIGSLLYGTKHLAWPIAAARDFSPSTHPTARWSALKASSFMRSSFRIVRRRAATDGVQRAKKWVRGAGIHPLFVWLVSVFALSWLAIGENSARRGAAGYVSRRRDRAEKR